MPSDDPFERFSEGREPAPDFVGIREEDLQLAASEVGIEDVRIVVRDGWFAFSSDVAPARLSVIVEGGVVRRAWWG